jgi:HAD superfamily hydrolase (TIGR01490 family)
MNLALFDFDGTITTKDSFGLFLKYVMNKNRSLRTKIISLSPVFVAMKTKLLSEQKAKETMLAILFKGWIKTRLNKIGAEFSKTILPSIMRPIALEKIKLHKAEGDKVVVVTASLDSWIKAWCEPYEIESICSELEIKEGLITGKLTGRDCIGDEKVKRIQAQYNLNDYKKVFAYGDSYRDKEMLDMADVAYYKWEKIEK